MIMPSMAILAITITILLFHRYKISQKSIPEYHRTFRRDRFHRLEKEILGDTSKLIPISMKSNTASNSGTTGIKMDHLINDNMNTSFYMAATIDSIIPGAEYGWNWAHVDHHLFQSVLQMTHQSIHSVADLGHTIDMNNWAANSFTGVDPSLVNAVK
jgi:hypothetical protein